MKWKVKNGKWKIALFASALLLIGGMARAQVKVGGNIYGGGEMANVNGSDTIRIAGRITDTVVGDVFGGGMLGQVKIDNNGNGGNTVVEMSSGVIGRAFGGGEGSTSQQTDGLVEGNTKVDLSGDAKVLRNVYGGGNLASVGNGDVNDKTKGVTTVLIRGGEVGPLDNNGLYGYVFAGSKGLNANYDVYRAYANVDSTSLIMIGGTVWGSIYGGSEDGHVIGDATVTISGGSLGTTGKTSWDGNVFGGGRNFEGLVNTSGRVGGNTYVNVSGTAIVKGNVFGGGRKSSVGIRWNNSGNSVVMQDGDDHGNIFVNISGGTIGLASLDTVTSGSVAGGCMGTKDPNHTPGDLSDVALGHAKNTYVTISGGNILNHVLGGSAYGTIQQNANVTMTGGEIGRIATGHTLNDTVIGGQLYGGGRGVVPDDISSTTNHHALYGIVMGNTNVTVKGGIIHSNVYGGGKHGSVGTYGSNFSSVTNGTGTTNVTIMGGTIGTPSVDDGMNGYVFGGGEGMGNDPNNKLKYHGTVVSTNVMVDSAAYVTGSVFGGGDAGHVWNDVLVQVRGGRVGMDGQGLGDGCVYGGGGNLTESNFTAGRVGGNTHVIVQDSALIYNNVYGGGYAGLLGVDIDGQFRDPASYGKTLVEIKNGTIGADKGEGHVFGGGNGSLNDYKFGYVASTEVSVSNAQINGNVYGGGELGEVKTNTLVNINSGVIGRITYDKKQGNTGTILDTIIHATNSGKAFGGGKGSTTDPRFALVEGNTDMNINGGQVLYSVYGGGEMASVNDTAFVTVTGGQVGPAPRVETGYNIPIGLNGFDGYVFGGGQGIGDDPIDYLNHPYGAYYQHANVGTAMVTIDMPMPSNVADTINNRLWGSVFGGAEDGHVLGNAHVNYVSGLMGTTGTTSYDGNIFGGGRNYYKKNYTAGRVGGNTYVEMSGGQIYGSIFGGGRLGIVGLGETGATLNGEDNYQAMQEGPDHGNIRVVVKGGKVGNEKLMSTWTKTTMGDVFGGGKGDMVGVKNHPEASALLISLSKNTEVIIKDSIDGGNLISRPIIYGSVFGGGEVANVGNYTWKQGIEAGALKIYDIELRDKNSGLAKVTISGGIIGADSMQMRHDLAAGTYDLRYNDDVGHVFGGGEGYAHNPGSYATVNPPASGQSAGIHNNISLLDIMATVGHTEVTISDSAFVKGSVYGGSMNGHVLNDALVTVRGGQIGCGDTLTRRYTENEFATSTSLAECPHWPYGDNNHYYPFDPLYITAGQNPSNGESWFGNVFGGGSGFYPYVGSAHDHSDSLIWNPRSGIVEGQAKVVIEGGHILTAVYGGGEINSVLDTTFVEMSGGTVGVPRTFNEILAHPITCSLYGSGKGDPRTNFNTYTNVKDAIVEISGGQVFGSVFGGGEEGHVLENTKVTVSGNAMIGNYGYTGVDGHVFGAGRGYAGEALTAGTIGGNTEVNINGGVMLGSVYGGGRDGSVGTYLVPVNDPNYGVMQAGDAHGFTTVNITGGTIGNDYEAITHTDFDKHPIGGNVFGGGEGNLFKLGNGYSPLWAFLGKVKQTKVNITGGTIKSTVYGGGELGTVNDSAIVIVDGGTIWRDVYGGGYGSDSTDVITASTPNASITAMPMQISGRVYGNTLVKLQDGWVHKSVYGGGEMASVGTVDSTKHVEGTHALALSWPYEFTYVDDANHNPTGNANVQVTGGRVGITGKDYMGPWNSDGTPFYDPTTQAEQYEKARQDNGDVYGGGKGRAGERYLMAHAGNVNNAVVNINYLVNEATPDNYKDTLTANRKGCIAGAVYGGAENGHVNDSTSITLTKGLVGHAIYGGGKGKGKYKVGNDKVYSITAGRTYGNTHININPASNDDVYVIRSVFGGGNLASVGKGTYAGGNNDTIYVNDNYYGEFITNYADWDYVRNSGHTYVNIYGGTLGILDHTNPNGVLKDTIPYGSVFGGCRGMAVATSPTRFGFVNFTHVTIGNGSGTGPHILGSVYGGAQDGLVRWYANTVVNNGEIGVQYDASTAAGIMGSANPDTVYWVMRGNVFGGGAGLGLTDEHNPASFSHISGQVIQKANLTINGGTIHRNVYGGGNLALVGPKLFGANDPTADLAGATVNINGGIIGTSSDYGGSVYGGSRGLPNHDTITTGAPYLDFALCAHTLVNINSVTLAKNVYGGGENGQVGTQHRTEQWTHTSTVNINGTANIGGDVYGGGQGVWGLTDYTNDTISGRVIGTAMVNMNGGRVDGNVFGAGQRGVTYAESYANVSGGYVDQNVFGGAYGHQGYNHVLGLRTVNMRAGEVNGRVYGGSFYAEDARVFRPANFATNTSDDAVSVVNFSGGHACKQVFGAGDHGQSYGSTYVFVGTNAIMNAPYHTASPTGVYNEAYFNAHDNLIIDGDVYAGADFGDYSQYGAVFGTNTISGRSHIYVDGKDYDTQVNVPGANQTDFMYLRRSLFGCGTLNDGGRQGKQIMVRNYGHDVTHVPNDADPEPLVNATRIFQSIQFADSLIIESAHIRLSGRGMVNVGNASKEFAIYNIMDNVRAINGSSLIVDKPIDNIGNLHSNKSTNFANGAYPATPSYTEVAYGELSPNIGTQDETIDNKIRINKGGYMTVSITEVDNNNVSNTYYGALRGFFHLMTDGVYNAFAYARPKHSNAPGNNVASQYDYATDGGFVSYRKALNYFDVDGGIATTVADSLQMPYENHAPKSKHSNETYFRIWRFSENASSVLDVWLIAEAEPTSTPSFGTYVPSDKVKLPPMAGQGAYYRIKRTNDATPIAEINYGQEIKMVNAGKKTPGGTEWMYYDNGFVIDATNATEEEQTFMTNYPNNVFGLTAMPAGAFTGTGATNDTVLVCIDANSGLTTDTLWNFYNSALSPEIEFMLTHSKGVSGNFTWDPISITFEQVMDGNVIDEVTVYVHVVTKTRIDMDNHVKTYAMMTHSGGTGDSLDIYKAKVMLPTFQLYNGDVEAEWYLKEVKWHPNDTVYSPHYFDNGTLVECDTYLSYNPTKDFVGMMFYPTANVDDVSGWDGTPTQTPVDLGLYKYDGVGPNPLGSGYYLGKNRGEKPISFDFDLHYDSDQNIGLEGNCTMGVVELTVHFDNYKESSDSINHGQDVKFYVEILRRGKGKGFYIDGVNGDVLYSGHYPDAAQPSLAGLLYFAPDYEPVDSIYIVNKVTANAVTNLEWNTRYNQLKIFRYPGGHRLALNDEASSGTKRFERYLETYDNNPAYKGALVEVKTSMSVSSATINGAYNLPEMVGNYEIGTSVYPPVIVPGGDDHVLANAPLFEVDPGATLSLDGENHKTELFDNYNGSSHGGAVYVADGGTLRMRRDAHLDNNYVADSIVSGTVTKANYGGGAYLEGLATLVASDSVTVDNNYRITKTSGTMDTIAQNVYLNDYNTVITLGTMDGAYVGLSGGGKAKIGVTKTAWNDMEYMPIVYSDNPALLTPLESDGFYVNDQIIFDQQQKYGLFVYPRRQPNGDPNYLRKLYWVKTWVDAVTAAPTGFNANDINTPEELAWAISLVNGLNGQTAAPGTSFTITANIDMDQYIWVPIGVMNSNDYRYTGTFEGNGYMVSGIHSPFGCNDKGMFGATAGATISDLQAQVDLYNQPANNLGGLIGKMTGGTLTNCQVSGYLFNTHTDVNTALKYTGGLVGQASGGLIHSCFATDTLCGDKLAMPDGSMVMGGLVGRHESNNDLYNSYSRIWVGDENSTSSIGGLAGINLGNIENCYSDLGTQPYAAFAVKNQEGAENGDIKHTYANYRDSFVYVGDGANQGVLDQHGYFDNVKGIKEIGYLYDDNKVTLNSGGNNNYVPADISYIENHIIKWNGLLSALNEWVREKNAITDGSSVYYNKNFTTWFRPISPIVNADLPVLGFPKDNAMATLDSDGRSLTYSAQAYSDANHQMTGANGFDSLLVQFADKSASIFLYDDALNVAHVPTQNVKVSVNEDAVLMQKDGSSDFINTTVGVTFDNSSNTAEDYFHNPLDYDWHLLSTPLSNAKMGTTYWYKDSSDEYQPHDIAHDPDVRYQTDTVDIRSMVNSYFPNGLKMAAGNQMSNTDVKWDFYNYFEREYHWINLKRNKNNHFHRDAHENMPAVFDGRPYQLDEIGEPYRHVQIEYNGTDQASNASDDDKCVFTPGKGYMMAISQDSYMNSTGTLNKGNVDIDITYQALFEYVDDLSTDMGSNLVGNPYQAYLDLNKVSDGNTGINDYWVYDADMGLYAPYTKEASVNPSIPSRYVHPHQGFFVIAPSSALTTTMTFTPSMAGAFRDKYSYFRSDYLRPSYPLVNLFVSDNEGNHDLTIVEFNRPMVEGVKKIDNLRNADFQLYARFDGEDYGLLFTPTGTERVPVFFKTPTDGTYTLRWDKHNGEFDYMHLIDNIAGVDYDMLTHNEYTFESHARDYAARFYIVFNMPENDEPEEDIFAFFNGEGWVVNGSGRLELVDMVGHVLYADQLNGQPTIVHFDNYASGVYMLRLVNSKQVLKAQKIVIY